MRLGEFEFQPINKRKINFVHSFLSVLFHLNGEKLVIVDSFRFNILTLISRSEYTS